MEGYYAVISTLPHNHHSDWCICPFVIAHIPSAKKFMPCCNRRNTSPAQPMHFSTDVTNSPVFYSNIHWPLLHHVAGSRQDLSLHGPKTLLPWSFWQLAWVWISWMKEMNSSASLMLTWFLDSHDIYHSFIPLTMCGEKIHSCIHVWFYEKNQPLRTHHPC